MIKSYDINQLQKCCTLIQKSNYGKWKVRYFPTKASEIKKRITKRDEQLDVSVLVLLATNEIKGYLELLIDKEEKYLQILAFFAESNFSNVLDKYFEYIEMNYRSYKLHYVVSDFNLDVIKYMEQINASSDGLEVMIHVSKETFVYRECSDVIKMKKEHHNEFIRLHDSLYPGAFWTGNLILEDENRFIKRVLLNDEEVIGYSIVSNSKRSEEEIYFVYAWNMEKKLDLISDSLKLTFKTAKTVQLLLDSNEIKEIPLLKKLGFEEKEKIITYSIESI